MRKASLVSQFKITLQGSVVPVWRRIQVPVKYSFWDLHYPFDREKFDAKEVLFTDPRKRFRRAFGDAGK